MNEEAIAIIVKNILRILILYLPWKMIKYFRKLIPQTTEELITDLIKNKTIYNKAVAAKNLMLKTILLFLNITLWICFLGGLLRIPNQLKIDYEKTLAGSKNPQTLCNLGNHYLFSADNKKNYTKAKKYFEAAANQDYPPAIYMLGFLYHNGFGVDIDIKKAMKYYHNAADKNFVEAQETLGSLYIFDDIIKKDIAKGLHFLELAANNNSEKALCLLGLLHETGNIIPPNIDKAKQYYTAAVKKNDHEAQFHLGLLYQRENNFHDAKNLFEAAAKQGNHEAKTHLGVMHLNGMGVATDLIKAKKLFEEAAKEKDALALFHLGDIYFCGLGVSKNYATAENYWKQAAEQGDSDAKFRLGLLYTAGINVKQDIPKAKALFTAVAADETNTDKETAKNFLQALNNPELSDATIQKLKLKLQKE